MKAYINQDKVKIALDSRPLKYISDKMNEMGIEIQYNNFLHLYHNRINWLLIYAMAVAEILNVPMEDLFYIE
jgi:hypothetical protein